MTNASTRHRIRRVLTAAICVFWTTAQAERLPVTIYTIEHGLPNNYVNRILPDSRGFIWCATREGLSRFDGYGFVTYGVEDGLPSAAVNDLLETREGVYLVATDGGLARLETAPLRPRNPGERSPMFAVRTISTEPESQYVQTLYQGKTAVWLGTRTGLFQVEDPAGEMRIRPVAIGNEAAGTNRSVLDVREDRFGSLWIATARGLRRLWADGRIDVHFPDAFVQAVLEDRAGQVWVATRSDGLFQLTLDERSGRLTRTRTHTTVTGLPSNWINAVIETSDGELWAASPAGAIQVTDTRSDQPRIRLFSESQGLARGGSHAVASDRSGNLWLGTDQGAVKVARSGFSFFGPPDGIPWGISLMQTRSGDLCFIAPSPSPSGWAVHCLNALSFDVIQPRLPAGSFTWGWNQLMLEDRAGDWWFATREGVARFEKITRPSDLQGRSPDRWYGKAEGLTQPVILRLFEDSRGDIWMASVGEGKGRNGLVRWERATGTLHQYAGEPSLPDMNLYFVTAFGEDLAGNVWAGFSGTGGIARYRDGRFDRLDAGGLFRASVRNITRDSTGRLWVASHGGLIRIENPAAVSPTFAAYTTKEGLSSNEAATVVEDLHRQLYIGTGRGIDRLDPSSGRIKHYTARDGYTLGITFSSLLDSRTGHLWFGQQTGLSRLVPSTDTPSPPPPIKITRLEVAAEPEPLNPLGESAITSLQIAPDRNHMRIEYVAFGLGAGEDLRYQYRLEGAGDTWSIPSNQRNVNFGGLSPGSYRFFVRAINTDGLVSPQPASVTFTILAPIWRRWWFMAMMPTAVAAALYAAYRYRLARALELAAVRTRIATDLHDDIGANLTKIAILSEVARQQLGPHESGDRLSTIARISRESVASMSDVVWAINPRRDNVRDTIGRMRQHAEDVVSGRGVTLVFRAPEGDENFHVPVNMRRDCFLIFKEALNNAVRHSGCRTVTIDIDTDGSRLHLRIADDGKGFDLQDPREGNGLDNMRRRARGMHGTLEVESAEGRGTTVRLSVPGSFVTRLRNPA